LQEPLLTGEMEKIVALATDNNIHSLPRGDFVVAMYLMNLLVDRRAGRDKGPKYLPDYLPEWLKAVGACLNSGGDAELALGSAKATVNRLGPRRHHKSSTTSSPPIRERSQNKRSSLLDMDDEPLPSSSPHYVLMQPRQGKLYAQKVWVPATPTDPPPPYSVT
jgi:hypothetical protein